MSRPLIYRGTFASGMFQCIYQPGAAHWAMLPTTLEWHAVLAAVAVAAIAWPPLLVVSAAMLLMSVLVSGLQTFQATIARPHDGLGSRVVVFAFSYLQPLVRSIARYRTKWFYFNPAARTPWISAPGDTKFPLTGSQTVAYWSESARDRLEMLQLAVEYLARHRWGRIVDSGWTSWDLRIYCHPLVYLQVVTTQENHGGNRRLTRVQQTMRFRDITFALIAVVLAALLWLAATRPLAAGIAAAATALLTAILWLRATSLAGKVSALFDHVAERLDMFRCAQTRMNRSALLRMRLQRKKKVPSLRVPRKQRR